MKLRKPFCGIAALAMLAAGALSAQAAAETPGVVIERDGASWVEFAPEWGEPPARDGFDAALLRQARAAQTEEGRALQGAGTGTQHRAFTARKNCAGGLTGIGIYDFVRNFRKAVGRGLDPAAAQFGRRGFVVCRTRTRCL